MIIVRAPLRVSLAGGGTDIPEFFTKQFGAVVSFAINKYVTVLLNPKFDGRTRVSYRITEDVPTPDDLKHELVRAALMQFSTKGVEVVTVSDIPGEGSGLGSSSSLSVCLSMAMRHYNNLRTNLHPTVFAEEGYAIERLLCFKSVGKQDHYAAAYGGVRFYHFQEDGDVIVMPINILGEAARFLENDLMLFYTGITRSSTPILEDLKAGYETSVVAHNLGLQLRDIAVEMAADMAEGNMEKIPAYLHEGWMLKKRMAAGVSDPDLDSMYEAGLRAGAGGGKLLGAGGGGFLLFAGCWNKQSAIETALGLRRIPFKIELEGVKCIYKDGS